MHSTAQRIASVGLVASLLWTALSSQTAARAAGKPSRDAATAAAGVPLDGLSPAEREKVRRVVTESTLYGKGPRETFPGSPSFYQWLLDHPDAGVRYWRTLGARCTEITPLDDGRFRWADEQGSEVIWRTMLRTPEVRLWYADGSVKPGPLLPKVAVHAVVVMRSNELLDKTGRTWIRHQSELFLHTDSKAAAIITKIAGPAAPQLVEQCLGQLELFFSALVWVAEKHPERLTGGRRQSTPASTAPDLPAGTIP